MSGASPWRKNVDLALKCSIENSVKDGFEPALPTTPTRLWIQQTSRIPEF